MEISITKKDIPTIIVWSLWALLMLLMVSLTLGSYQEAEPIAGFRYGIVTGFCALLAPVIRVWLRKRAS